MAGFLCLALVALSGSAAALEATGDQTNQQVTLTSGPAAGQLKVCSSRTGKFFGTTFTIQSNKHVTAVLHYDPEDIETIQDTMDPSSSSNDLPHLIDEGNELKIEITGSTGGTQTISSSGDSQISAGANPLCLMVACFDADAKDGGGIGATCDVTYSIQFGSKQHAQEL